MSAYIHACISFESDSSGFCTQLVMYGRLFDVGVNLSRQIQFLTSAKNDRASPNLNTLSQGGGRKNAMHLLIRDYFPGCNVCLERFLMGIGIDSSPKTLISARAQQICARMSFHFEDFI